MPSFTKGYISVVGILRTNFVSPFNGLNLDALWEHLVVTIGDISLNTEQTLSERIQNKQEQERIIKEIEQLERKIDKRKSLGKQMQLRSQVNELKKRLILEFKC